MEAEAVLNLLDSSWFHLNIFENPPRPSTPEPNPDPPVQETLSISTQLSIHKRSKSDQLPHPMTSFESSPNSVLHKPHLQTILSGREISPENESRRFKKPDKKGFGKKRKIIASSKSLSELEFEELKGFMDLGFVFSEEDKEDLDLVGIIPGLQKLGREMELDQENESGPRVRRPYLSEAWEEDVMPLMKWRVPEISNEVVMKDCLKWWAHSVASMLLDDQSLCCTICK